MPTILTPQQIAQARTLAGPLPPELVAMMCDSHEQLRIEREVLGAEVQRSYSDLENFRKMRTDLVAELSRVLKQACACSETGALDSQGLSAYADALWTLAWHEAVTIERSDGPRVIARFSEKPFRK